LALSTLEILLLLSQTPPIEVQKKRSIERTQKMAPHPSPLDNNDNLHSKRTHLAHAVEEAIVSSLADDDYSDSSSSCSSTSFAEEDEDDALVGITRSPWETAGEDGDVNPDFFFYMSQPNKDTCVPQKPSNAFCRPSSDEEESDVSTTLVDDDSDDVYDDSDGEDPWAAGLPLEDDERKVVAKTRAAAPFISSISPWAALAPIEEEAECDEEDDYLYMGPASLTADVPLSFIFTSILRELVLADQMA
jgi:hypothetical protein